MLQTKEKTIGKNTYAVTELDATVGIAVLSRFVNSVAPGLNSLEWQGKLGATDLPQAVAGIFSNPALADNLKFFCDTFAKHTTVATGDGKVFQLSDVFALHFAAKYSELAKWLIFCFEVNLGDFLDNAKAAIQTQMAKASSSGSPTAPESTG